jgi:hypothetical protein
MVGLLMKDELKTMWNEAVVARFNVLSRQSVGG